MAGDGAGHSQRCPQPAGQDRGGKSIPHQQETQAGAAPDLSWQPSPAPTHATQTLRAEFWVSMENIFAVITLPPFSSRSVPGAPGCLKCVTPSALLSSQIRARLTTEKPKTNKSLGQSSSQRLRAETLFLPVNGCGSCSNHKPLPSLFLFLQKTMKHLCFPRPGHYRKTRTSQLP